MSSAMAVPPIAHPPGLHPGARVGGADRRRQAVARRSTDQRGLLGLDGVAPDLADLALLKPQSITLTTGVN
jgi:hypothetical protein